MRFSLVLVPSVWTIGVSLTLCDPEETERCWLVMACGPLYLHVGVGR